MKTLFYRGSVFPFYFSSHFINLKKNLSTTTVFYNFKNNYLSDEQAQNISSIHKEFGIKSLEFDNLKLEGNEYKYLHNLKLPNNIKWVGPSIKIVKLGQFKNTGLVVDNIRKLLYSFNKEQSYSALFAVQTAESFYTLDRQYLINYNSDPEVIYAELLRKESELPVEKYGSYAGDILICKYRPLHLKLNKPVLGTKVQLPKGISKHIPSNYFNYKKLPFTMDLQFYGTIYKKSSNSKTILYIYNNIPLLVTILNPNLNHRVDVLSPDHSSIKFSFIDEKFNDHFIRVIMDSNSKRTIFQKFGMEFNLLYIEYPYNFYFMPRITKKDLVQNTNIITFDIETYLDNQNNSIPYACGFYDGNKSYFYYSMDFDNPRAMLLQCIRDMMHPRYKNHTVYSHNFSGFDSIFLYSLLFSYFKVKFLSKDSHIISMTISSLLGTPKNLKSKLTFRDSARLLPDTLKELAISFDVPVTKGIFPYLFVNSSNLNYIGPIPDSKYYNQDDETKLIYSQLLQSSNWSLRSETLTYLKKDLISLHQIILKMSKLIYSNYRLNITSFATLSGLSLAIFRSNFMKDHFKLPMLIGTVDKAVRSAYYGGATDVIIPIGKNLYYYDVNSLYPTVMLKPMPIGNPTYSTIKDLSKIFGFSLATVTSPGNKIPILPFKKSDGTLIFPNGTWTGWFFSEELKQAVGSYGYKAEIHESYIFERGFDIFKGYVETMAEIKQNSKGANRKIHKLLMNSLYGRMGMNNEPEKIKVLNSEEIRNIHMSYQVIDNFPLTEDLEYIRYLAFPDYELCAQSGIDFTKLCAANDHVRKEVLSSSPIAAATTAYARMFMNPIKFIHDNKFYYGDTDSGVLQKPLSEKMVGNLLGQFKLEYSNIKEGIFPAPKLYFLQLDNDKTVAKGKGYSGTLSVIDYYQLYEGKFIEVLDKRWFKNLQLNTINVSERVLKISPIFNKRNKLYSLGKWVDTSPLCVNPDGSISCLDLILYNGLPMTHLQQILSIIIYPVLPYKLLPAPKPQSSYIYTSTPDKVSL